MLNEKLIEEFCEENGYSYNYFGQKAIIETPLDEWKLEGTNKYNYKRDVHETIVKLGHKNVLGNSSGKSHFHTQRIVGKIEYALETIVQHNTHKGAYGKIGSLLV